MTTIRQFGIALALLALMGAGGFAVKAHADVAEVAYPVAELGSCGSQAECKAYCDDSAHAEACLAFAEKNNLMSSEEVSMAKKFLSAGGKGPGGCTGKDSCEAYCNDTSHIDACISFAEQNDMMSPGELAEAKKVQAAIRNGVQPPPCGGKKACNAYCAEPENMPACITFAKQAGLMSPEDAANADKMIAAIQAGAKPPACQGKEECDAYCAEESHFNECMDFAKAAGFVSDQEYEMAKKTGGKGPGGCVRDECKTFCDNPENQQVCFEFGKEHGLIPPEELQKMEEGNKQFRDGITNAPPSVRACLEAALGSDTVSGILDGSRQPSREMGDKMGECFRQAAENQQQQQQPPQQPQQMPNQGEQGMRPPEGQQGPMPPEGFDPGSRPPEGFVPPGPNGPLPPGEPGSMPPEGFTGPPPEGEQFQPPAMPPQGEMPPGASAPAPESVPAPVTDTSAPTSLVPQTSLMATAINFLKGLLK